MFGICELNNSTQIKPYVKHNTVQTGFNTIVSTAAEGRGGEMEEEGLVKRIVHCILNFFIISSG